MGNYKVHNGKINNMVVSLNGNFIYSAGEDKTVNVFEFKTRKVIRWL